MNTELLEGVCFFTRERRIMSGLSVACGAGDRLETAMDGEDISDRSLFDLASVTKLFTGLCAMRLKEKGRLDFSRTVASYDPRFQGLKDVTVEELMTFAVELKTAGRVDACPDRDSALKSLFGTVSLGQPAGRAYSDIPAMILKYVLESASGLPLYDCVREEILKPAGMRETWARVPAERLADCQSYDREHRLIRGEARMREGLQRGVPHDPKAALLQGAEGDLCGHAGLFSTRADLIRFCRAVLAGEIVGPESLRETARNRTGVRRADGSWQQFLGCQCYVRHPVQYHSEIPVYMGRRAFGIGGFTGNHLALDPERGVFSLFLGNRVKNRLTVLVCEEGKTLEDYGLKADGSGSFFWPGEGWIPSSVNYVHLKDEHLHRRIRQVLDLPEIPFA